MTSDAPGPDPLAGDVERLERIAAELRDPDVSAEALRRLADEALEVSKRISEMLPATLRDPEAGGD